MIHWRGALTSWWFAYFVLLWGAILFEFATSPWKSGRIIPNPYIMFYALATLGCAFRGYLCGLSASLTWYTFFLWLDWTKTSKVEIDGAQVMRCLFQIGAPLLVSNLVETSRADQRRLAVVERKLLAFMEMLSTAVPHKLNNRLMAIMGLCAEVQDTLPRDSAGYAKLTLVITTSDETAGIVRTMQRYARNGIVSPELLDAANMIREIEAPAKHVDSLA